MTQGGLTAPLWQLDRPTQETWPQVNPQLPITRSPDSPHRLYGNFGDSWVTSWATSPHKHIYQNALNKRES
jgi:hypothetical protein